MKRLQFLGVLIQEGIEEDNGIKVIVDSFDDDMSQVFILIGE
jgi:hypothetical protein